MSIEKMMVVKLLPAVRETVQVELMGALLQGLKVLVAERATKR